MNKRILAYDFEKFQITRINAKFVTSHACFFPLELTRLNTLVVDVHVTYKPLPRLISQFLVYFEAHIWSFVHVISRRGRWLAVLPVTLYGCKTESRHHLPSWHIVLVIHLPINLFQCKRQPASMLYSFTLDIWFNTDDYSFFSFL